VSDEKKCMICSGTTHPSKADSGDGLTCVFCYYGLWRPHLKNKWAEDDAHPPDAETFEAAWLRITGKEWDQETALVTHDMGDGVMYYFDEGWVAGRHCDGSDIARHESYEKEDDLAPRA